MVIAISLAALGWTRVASAASPDCKSVGDTCEQALSAAAGDAPTHIFGGTVCPWVKGLIWEKASGCMASDSDWCCCCDSGYVTETNKALSENFGAYFGPDCKSNPLQCNPNFDCSSCEADASPCPELTAEIIPNLASGNCDGTLSAASCDNFTCIAEYIADGDAKCDNGVWDSNGAQCLAPCPELTAEIVPNLASGNCDGTLSSASCDDFTCADGFIAAGDALCNNGKWDISGAKCNKIDWCAHKPVPRAIYRPAFNISAKFTKISMGSLCRQGVDLGLRMQASTRDECAQACHSSSGPNPQNLSRADLLHTEWGDPKWNGMQAAGFSFSEYSFLSKTFGPSYYKNLRGYEPLPANFVHKANCFCHPVRFESCLINNENDQIDWVGKHYNAFLYMNSNFAKSNLVTHYDFNITKIDDGDEPLAPFKMSYLKEELGSYPFTKKGRRYACNQVALDDITNSVHGVLSRGQTCVLDKAVIVPACTHLSLKGGEDGDEAAILSGGAKNQHFRVNGKLTLRDLVLEKGRGVFGGSIQVQGLFAQAHLIDTIIRNCHVEKPATHALIRLAGGGAIHVNVGMEQRKLERGINDDVRLILEGDTQIVNNTAYEGTLLFCFVSNKMGENHSGQNCFTLFVDKSYIFL